MRKSLFVGALVVCAVMVFSSSMVLAADNWLGTWKLSVEKSKFSPGWPAPKSLTIKFEASPAGTRSTSDGVSAEGKPMHGSYASKYDGKDVPWEGNPDADTASPKKIDDNTYENVWKKGGKVSVTAKGVVSKDGKTLTVSLTGKNAKGETVNTTIVYEKQ
jgi:hypothetical protein